MQQKFQRWRRPTQNSIDLSRDSLINLNRISKDRFGNDLSRISMNVEALNSIDSQVANDLESCKLTTNEEETKSQYKTETSRIDRFDQQEDYKEFLNMNEKSLSDNRLAQSERVKSKSKSTTYFNYLQNRMSVRIKYGGQDKSLAKRLLGTYNNN